jgi:hypothetical protein
MTGILKECYGLPVSVKDVVDDNHYASHYYKSKTNEQHGIGKKYAGSQRV